MSEKTFSQISTEELVADLMEAAKRPQPKKPLLIWLLPRKWCCAAMKTSSLRLRLKDGTAMRIFYCPRCGKEL